METLWHDIRHGFRVLMKARAFTAVAVLSLAIGIGANSAIFSVTDAMLLRPLPYRNAEGLAMLWQRSPGLNVTQDWFSIGQYLDIKNDNSVFESVAAGIGASFNLTGLGDTPERIDGVRVSSSLFGMLGANAVAGRVFTSEEDQPGKPPSVILMHGFWQRRFGSDPNVIGRTLTLNGTSFSIIGVMTSGFVFDKAVMPAVNGIQTVDLLLPLPVGPTARTNRGGEDFNIFARLKPGVSQEKAQADMDLLAARMKQQYPANYPPNGGLTISVVPLLNQVVGDVRLALYVLLGAVTCVLLIACGNVANLLLSRAAVREKEIAIRTAVGAVRSRIVRQLLTENVLLALLGGIAGTLFAMVAVQSLRYFAAANIPRLNEISIDLRVVGFTFAVSLFTGIVFGLLPAIRASRPDTNVVLKEGGRSSVGTSAFGLGHGQLRKLLITTQVALSLVLLIGAGLLIRSYSRITDASPGFNPKNVLTMRVTLPGFRYKNAEMITAFFKQLDDRIKALPGVEYVGANYMLPLSSVALAWEPIGIEGYVPPASEGDLIIASSGYISPDYFNAMGVKLLEGRFFTDTDTRESPEVVIIDDKLAERFWPGQSAIGKRMRRGSDGPWRTVIGVVPDGREFEINAEPPITVYYPLTQVPTGSRFLAIRTKNAPETLIASVTSEIRSLDPELPTYDVSTMEQRLTDALARRRFSMFLLGTFASLALVLAAIGIYGVIAYWVDQRTREIGIRMALGAEESSILKLVLQQSVAMVGMGLILGVAAAFALGRVMKSMVFGVSTTDAVTFALLPIVLAVVALIASYVPARRALRVDPLVAVRSE